MHCSLFCRTKLCFFNAFFFLFIISSFTCFHVISGTAIGFDYGVHCKLFMNLNQLMRRPISCFFLNIKVVTSAVGIMS
ncbi:hypothetical protein Gotur_016547 [Gossypium turneri]